MEYYLVGTVQIGAGRRNSPSSPAISTVALRSLPRNSTALSTACF